MENEKLNPGKGSDKAKKLLMELLAKKMAFGGMVSEEDPEMDDQEMGDEEDDKFSQVPNFACGGVVEGYAEGGEVESPEDQRKKRVMSGLLSAIRSKHMQK